MEQYEKALTAFIELGEYKDSKRKIAEIDSVLQARAEIEDIRSLGIELDNFITARESLLKQILDSVVAVMGDASKVKIGENGNIVLSDSVFFDVGSAAIKTEAVPTLNQLTEVFSQFLADPENVRYVDSICHTIPALGG